MCEEKILKKILLIARALILQDLFLEYRTLRKIPRYTIVKISEELLIIFVILITTLFVSIDLHSLVFLAGVIHSIYAFLAPPVYNCLNIKKIIRPVSRRDAIEVLSTMLSKVSKHISEVYVTGSICYDAQDIRDVDITLVPKSYFSTYILFLHLRMWILKFIMRRIQFIPDIYIHERNFYSYTCELKVKIPNE